MSLFGRQSSLCRWWAAKVFWSWSHGWMFCSLWVLRCSNFMLSCFPISYFLISRILAVACGLFDIKSSDIFFILVSKAIMFLVVKLFKILCYLCNILIETNCTVFGLEVITGLKILFPGTLACASFNFPSPNHEWGKCQKHAMSFMSLRLCVLTLHSKTTGKLRTILKIELNLHSKTTSKFRTILKMELCHSLYSYSS